MERSTINQWTIGISDDYLNIWIDAFLFDPKAQNLSAGTLHFYNAKLTLFSDFCDSQLVNRISEITPALLREYLVYLSDKGHNPGGIHGCYRALKTFLYWWEDEIDPEDWINPLRKVKAAEYGSCPSEKNLSGKVYNQIKWSQLPIYTQFWCPSSYKTKQRSQK